MSTTAMLLPPVALSFHQLIAVGSGLVILVSIEHDPAFTAR